VPVCDLSEEFLDPRLLTVMDADGLIEFGHRNHCRAGGRLIIENGWDFVSITGPDKNPIEVYLDEAQNWTGDPRIRPHIQLTCKGRIEVRRRIVTHSDTGRSDAISAQDDGARPELIASHAPDFTSVNWFGVKYEFSKGQQSNSVKHLWHAWENGGHSLSQEMIGDRIGSEARPFRLSPVFRGHPAWGTMIQRGKKGVYRLVPPKKI